MAIIVGTLAKDPDETRLFKMDWSSHIGTGTIANSSWSLTAGVTLVANGIVSGNTTTYITVSGGTVGHTYILTNTVHLSSNGEVLQRSGRLDIRAL